MRQILNVDTKNYNIIISDEDFSVLVEEINKFTAGQKRLFVFSKKVYKLYKNELCLNEDEIFILGEGEISLEETIHYIANGKKDEHFFDNATNVFDKKHPTCSIREEKLVYKNPLFTKFNNIDTDFLYYETSRGCAYKCGYCGFRNREQIENFDLEFVEEEIKRIGRIGFKEVFVVDANLGGTPDRAKNILRMFNMYANNSKLTIYLRPEFIDDEMVELLDAANLKEVRIGIQTVNEKIPSWIRSNSLNSITTELPKLHTRNIPWKAEFIIGLPGDDMEGLKKSLDFAENVLHPAEICCYPLTLIRDTPMFELVDSEGTEWIKMDDNYRAYESYTYTHEELEEMQAYAISRMNNYLRQGRNIDDNQRISKMNRNRVIYKDVR